MANAEYLRSVSTNSEVVSRKDIGIADVDFICLSCDDGNFLQSKNADRPLCSICLNPNCVDDCCVQVDEEADEGKVGATRIMRNLRGLLWYWREYYLRRGRDRLSIEFSTHIPFRYWMELVGKEYLLFPFICMKLNRMSRFALPR